MSTYNHMFKLSIKDIDVIEQAIRQQIEQLSSIEVSSLHNDGTSVDNQKQILELTQVLGNLHNQKIWYGQKHHTGVPLG